MLKICLTYDYELFMGKNLCSYDEILFEPTEEIVAVMDRYGVKGTFFADVCSAISFKNYDLPDYSDKFEKQIKKLTSGGHDVQLHLHTSWLSAERLGNEIVLSDKGYKIHEFGFDKNQKNCIQNIVSQTKNYLENVCGSVKPDYKCIAYRAGGFAVQPESELFKTLVENGILIDSSVVPHLKTKDAVNSFDFSDVPNSLNWYINPQTGISVSAEKEGSLFEVPVATAKPRLLECVGKKSQKLRLPPAPKRGEYVKFSNNTVNKKQNQISRFYHRLFDYRYISLDTRYYEVVYNDLLEIYKKYKCNKKDAYICLICHPKLADRARVENIGKLIEKVKSDSEKFSFTTMTEIYEEIL